MLPPLDAAVERIKEQIARCEANDYTMGHKWPTLDGMTSCLAAVERLRTERDMASLREAGYDG